MIDTKRFRAGRVMKIVFVSLISVELLALFIALCMSCGDDRIFDAMLAPIALMFAFPPLLCEFRLYRCLRYLIVTDIGERTRPLTLCSVFSLVLSSVIMLLFAAWFALAAGLPLPGVIGVVVINLIDALGYNGFEVFLFILVIIETVDAVIAGLYRLRQWSGDSTSQKTNNQ